MLYEISGNETMLRFQKLLIPVFDFVYHKSHLEKQVILKKNEVSHRDLYNSLLQENPDAFRTKMKKHLKPYFENISS